MGKLAISSIAWTNSEELKVARKLQELGVTAIEIAPTKIWEDPSKVSEEQISEYVAFWQSHRIEIVALQSMLFNRSDLTIFESESKRNETTEVLTRYIELASKMGASKLVFGSPKNRQKNNLSDAEANQIAEEFFDNLGSVASRNNVFFCIEPNPTDYACDFITNTRQGAELVERVNNPGFRLHLDIAGMTLAGDEIYDGIKSVKSLIKHFHISAPFLRHIEESDIEHGKAAKALKEIGYEGNISIEMRPVDDGTNVDRVTRAVEFAKIAYAEYLGASS